jgi:hypothetical protein
MRDTDKAVESLTCNMVGDVLGLEVARDADVAELGQLPPARQQDVERLQVPVHDLQPCTQYVNRQISSKHTGRLVADNGLSLIMAWKRKAEAGTR